MTTYNVTPLDLQTGAANCDKTADSIETTLATLKTMVAGLADEWRGYASTEFQTLMANWDTHSRNLNEALTGIAAGLRANAHNYADTEHTVHSNFSVLNQFPPLAV